MQNGKRWYRFFKLDGTREDVERTVAESCDPAKYTKSSFGGQYTPEDRDDFVGKTLVFRGEERVFEFAFEAINDLMFSENGGEKKKCYCNVKSLDGEVYFVNFLVPGYATSRQITLVTDTKTGYSTVCDAHVGTENTAIDVGREFIFGRMDGDFAEGTPHGFTNELVGTAIEWTYGPKVMPIKHMYISNLYYTYGAAAPGGAWLATNPADYVKVRDRLYIFSFVEERQGGLQALFLIDLDRMHDVGCFYSAGSGHLISACVGATGKLASTNTIF